MQIEKCKSQIEQRELSPAPSPQSPVPHLTPHLTVHHGRGMAWETDPDPIPYGRDYLAKYARYDATPLGRELTRLRLDLVERHLSPPAALIDVGIGAGGFLFAARQRGFTALGYDVNPHALELLGTSFADPYQAGRRIDALTLWDSLEHLCRPDVLLSAVRPGKLVFLSLPICPDLYRLREWKHFRPGEHLWYWTDLGFQLWIQDQGFQILESNSHETAAGRQDIRSYALRKIHRENRCA